MWICCRTERRSQTQGGEQRNRNLGSCDLVTSGRRIRGLSSNHDIARERVCGCGRSKQICISKYIVRAGVREEAVRGAYKTIVRGLGRKAEGHCVCIQALQNFESAFTEVAVLELSSEALFHVWQISFRPSLLRCSSPRSREHRCDLANE